MALDQAIQAVFYQLDRDRGFVVDLTRKLVSFRSINPKFMDRPQESEEPELQLYLNGVLRASGLETESWEPFERRPNVVGRRAGAGGGRSLILNGHIDVVPPGDPAKWRHDPWAAVIEDGRMYGRGTYDMKGGLAAAIAAVRAIEAAGIRTKGRVEVHAVVDEEGGGGGTRSVMDRGYTADGVIVAEPTQGVLHPVEGGLEWVRVTFAGKTAHAGSRYRHIYPQPAGVEPGAVGVNAIEKGWKFLGVVRELEREWALRKHHPLLPAGITTINPGVVVGGAGIGSDGLPLTLTNPAIIPDTCVIELDLKYLPTETPAGIRAEFEAFVSAFAQTDPWLREHPPVVEWGVRGISFPPVSTPVDHPLVLALSGTRARLGLPVKLTGFVAVTDAAFYAGKGIPAVIYGPSGDGAHAENEYVEVASLHETARIFAAAILDWCGVEDFPY